MSLDAAALMEAVGTALGSLTGVRVYDYPPDSVSPPCAIVSLPSSVEYEQPDAGSRMVSLEAHLIVNKATARTAAARAAALMSDGLATVSVKAAVEADATLGGACAWAHVSEAESNTMTIAGTDYLAVTFTILILV